MTSRTASIPSSTVNTNAWWIVPSWSATTLAALRSGEPSNPTENECSAGNHALSPAAVSPGLRLVKLRDAIEATSELSSPPDSSTPHGTSDIIRRTTAASNCSRSSLSTSGLKTWIGHNIRLQAPSAPDKHRGRVGHVTRRTCALFWGQGCAPALKG